MRRTRKWDSQETIHTKEVWILASGLFVKNSSAWWKFWEPAENTWADIRFRDAVLHVHGYRIVLLAEENAPVHNLYLFCELIRVADEVEALELYRGCATALLLFSHDGACRHSEPLLRAPRLVRELRGY